MKSWLLALGLALCCLVQAEWKEVTTVGKMNGSRWVTHSVACNSEFHLEQMRNMSAIVAEVTQPAEDVYSISARVPMPDGCKNVTHQLKRGEDGKLQGDFDGTRVRVEFVKSKKLQVNYFMITATVNELNITILLSQEQKLDRSMAPDFENECKKLGYTAGQILHLKESVVCQ